MKSSDNEERLQRQWYAAQLHYEFGAKIDTVSHLKQKWDYSEIHFSGSQGQVELMIEDSLQSKITTPLRLITKAHNGRLKLVLQNSADVEDGDSLYVSSSMNQISIFRGKEVISTHRISSSLMDRWFR